MLLWLAGVLVCVLAPRAAWARPQNVLVLNSYHPTYTWTRNIVDGVQSVLAEMPEVELSVDYMDTKKLFTAEYAEALSRLYAQKYAKIHFDVVIATDDDALDFLLKYRDSLFPSVPVVFCGINNFQDSRIAGHTGYTGVNEANDIARNFDWLQAERPQTRRIVVIHDQSATGLAMYRQIRAIQPKYESRFAFEYVTSLTKAELSTRVRAVPEDAVIYWAVFMRDQAGVPLSPRQSMSLVAGEARVPVFSFWDFAVIEGTVGGYVVSGRHQGEAAARLTEKILRGTAVSQVPVVRESPNVFMFDHRALTRWHFDLNRVPKDAVILHRPFSFYETYKSYVWAALGGMGLESTVILVLLSAIRTITRKNRAKLRASEERYRSIVEDGSELIGRMSADGVWTFVNGALARACASSGTALVGESFWALVSDAERESVRSQLQALSSAERTCSFEHRLVAADRDGCWVQWTCRGMFDDHGRLVELQLVGRDVTLRRQAEEAVHEALTRVERGNSELRRVNDNLQGVLDGMSEALFVCDLRGQITPIRSRATLDWFGEPASEIAVWDYVGGDAREWAQNFRLAFEQLAEDLLPFAINAEQMPHRLQRDGRTFQIDCRQVCRDGAFSEVLFIVTDVTAQINQERAERINRELPVIVGHLLRDRAGFQDFVADTEGALGQLASIEDRTEQRRSLHTIKGNTAVYGFSHFSARCHALEDRMNEEPSAPSSEEIEQLVASWAESLSSVGVFLTNEPDDAVRIAREEYRELLRRIAANDDYQRLLQTARTWVHPPTEQILEIHVAGARQLARRFGKEVETRIVDHGLRLPSSSLRGFFSTLVHVVRNAVDHGIEEPALRVASGKTRTGHLSLETVVRDACFGVIVEDDGKGIDWDRVRDKARALGLAVENESDLVLALSKGGVSTKDAVSDVSGRGLGMSAVFKSCRELGGTVSLRSSPGNGTRFEFWFPFDALKYSLIPLSSEKTESSSEKAESGVHRSAAPIATTAEAVTVIPQRVGHRGSGQS